MLCKLTSALDGPDKPEDTAKDVRTSPIVLKNDPKNPKTKYSKLKP